VIVNSRSVGNLSARTHSPNWKELKEAREAVANEKS
jgi:hypothetical protein